MRSVRPARLVAVLSTLAALATLGLPTPAAAQDRDVQVYTSSRPRLGVMLETRGSREADRIGAKISQVVPDSPADKAGLRSGDIITRFNGTSLAVAPGDSGDQASPAARLIDLVGDLSPGDTVKLEYRREGSSRSATAVLRDLPQTGMRNFQFKMPEMGQMPRMFDGPDVMPGGDVRVFVNHEFGGLNLAEMNPGLGEYFGTRDGVLVLETPADSTMPLRAGDVILTVDGRQIKSVSQAQRILLSYDPGETARLEVMRKQRKLTLNWEAKEPTMRWKEPGPMRRRAGTPEPS
jgi:S1-C subfamily serine protease